jgi:hypothetical protein
MVCIIYGRAREEDGGGDAPLSFCFYAFGTVVS